MIVVTTDRKQFITCNTFLIIVILLKYILLPTFLLTILINVCHSQITFFYYDRHVSLRITAIRETFEELGLLICSREHKPTNSLWASAITDIDVKHWQNRVSLYFDFHPFCHNA